jgi:hypothetical protein
MKLLGFIQIGNRIILRNSNQTQLKHTKIEQTKQKRPSFQHEGPNKETRIDAQAIFNNNALSICSNKQHKNAQKAHVKNKTEHD